MQLLGNYPQLLKRTKYFIDNNSTKHGKVICGKEICSPQRLVYEEENIVILICSIKNTEEIRKQIMGMGLNKKKIITVGN